MDFYYFFVTLFIPILVNVLFIYLINSVGEYPTPLPHSDNPRRDYTEILIYILIVIFFLILNVFVLNYFTDSFYISLCLDTIILLLIPLAYVRYRDHWTSKDLGITSKVRSRWVVIFSLFFSSLYGFLNTFTYEVPWDKLLIFFYSNAFLEEFLFRAVIQSKLERAIDQKKAIIYQALLFMLIHIPINFFHFLLDGDAINLFLKYTSQFFKGIFFGLVFLKTRSIWISVISHYLINWLGAIITLFL